MTTYTGTITADQMAAVLADRDQWMSIALSTDRCDRPAAEQAVHAAYRAAGLEPPKLTIWMDSPMGGAYAILTLSQLGDQLGDQLWDQLRGQLWGQLWDQLRGQRDLILNRNLNAWYESYWECLYRHALAISGLPESDRLNTMIAATQAVGWWWPMTGAVILTDRPTRLCRDNQGRLHSPDGPALSYADGYGLWAWHGTRVPQSVIDGTWTPADILREPNAEIRRCAIEVMGWDRYITTAGLAQVGATVDDPGNPGQTLALYDVPEQIYDEPVRVLLCTNGTVERDGTRRRFGLTVPATIGDPVAAAAWGYDLDPAIYATAQRRA